ncbi:MAG TPA: class I SAM-dependent methyltransferase [Actinomycetota bacterium]
MADLYDALKAGEDYAAWADLVVGLLDRWSPPGRRMLDVGCGTGNSSAAFVDRGFSVVGCDISEAMLTQAQRKFFEKGMPFLAADMRSLPHGLNGFDTVLWMDDVANHLLAEADLLAALRESCRVLSDGGLLVFDVNNRAAFRTVFSEWRVVPSREALLVWQGQTFEFTPGGLGRVHLTAFTRSRKGVRRRDADIVERHFPPDVVETIIGRSGLSLVGAFGLGGGRLHPPDEDRFMKTIYVAQRERAGA